MKVIKHNGTTASGSASKDVPLAVITYSVGDALRFIFVWLIWVCLFALLSNLTMPLIPSMILGCALATCLMLLLHRHQPLSMELHRDHVSIVPMIGRMRKIPKEHVKEARFTMGPFAQNHPLCKITYQATLSRTQKIILPISLPSNVIAVHLSFMDMGVQSGVDPESSTLRGAFDRMPTISQE